MKNPARLRFALPLLSVFSQPPAVVVEMLLAEVKGQSAQTRVERLKKTMSTETFFLKKAESSGKLPRNPNQREKDKA